MSNIKTIFSTEALNVAPEGQAFFYTSGLIGPFYINTHYLCGGRETALELLDFISEEAGNPKTFIPKLLSKLTKLYDSDITYKTVIDELADKITKQNLALDYISGGQRRDWFFSPMIAKKLNLPCLYLYKDLNCYDESGEKVDSIAGKKVINVADLFNTASSFIELWKPAIEKIGGELVAAAAAVDRMQGGSKVLANANINHCIALYELDQDFFTAAENLDLISKDQATLLNNYRENPNQIMKQWLKANPGFIKENLNSADAKTQQRAADLQNKNPYNLS